MVAVGPRQPQREVEEAATQRAYTTVAAIYDGDANGGDGVRCWRRRWSCAREMTMAAAAQ